MAYSEYYILPTDREPNVFDKGRAYLTKQAAIDMLVYQGYGRTPQDPDYWGNTMQIVPRVDTTASPVYTGPMPETPENPVTAQLKSEIDKIREKALGPHLDTPIYDQLAREYDAKYSNLSYFETELGKRISHLSKFVSKHAS